MMYITRCVIGHLMTGKVSFDLKNFAQTLSWKCPEVSTCNLPQLRAPRIWLFTCKQWGTQVHWPTIKECSFLWESGLGKVKLAILHLLRVSGRGARLLSRKIKKKISLCVNRGENPIFTPSSSSLSSFPGRAFEMQATSHFFSSSFLRIKRRGKRRIGITRPSGFSVSSTVSNLCTIFMQ